MTLIGENFIGRRPKVTVDGAGVETSPIDDTRLLVILPFLREGQDHSLTVAYGDDESEPFVFQTTRPEHVSSEFGFGASIRVTSLSMSNVADTEISVKEAFLLANGGLGRGLSDAEETKVPGWEMAGTNRRDTISFDFDSRGQTLVMTEALPPIDRADRVNFRGLILDGSNAPDGSDGLVLDGTSEAEISEVTLIGWDGDGIRITNGSSGNTFRFVEIESVGDAGLFIDNESSFNSFTHFTVRDTGGDGISMSGDSSHNLFSDVSLEVLGRHGVHLTNRANRQHLDGLSIKGAAGHGLFLDGEASSNRFTGNITLDAIGGTGLKFSGAGVRNNLVRPIAGQRPLIRSELTGCEEYGILVEQQASFNSVALHVINQCKLGGILVVGDGTKGNTLGRPPTSHTEANLGAALLVYTEVTESGVFDDQGVVVTPAAGVRVADGAEGNLIVGVASAGNAGDGFLIEGDATRFNSILRSRQGTT